MRVFRKYRTPVVNVENPESLRAEFQKIDQNLQDLFRAINAIQIAVQPPVNGGLVGNLDARFLVFTSNAVANADTTLQHLLGRIPRGILNVELPVETGATPDSGRVYFGSESPTDLTITVRCTTASARKCVIVF